MLLLYTCCLSSPQKRVVYNHKQGAACGFQEIPQIDYSDRQNFNCVQTHRYSVP